MSEEKENLVFLLWGGFAKEKIKYIDVDKHHVLSTGHPSPLSANRGYWFGNKHFSQCNSFLKKKGKTPIKW
jgi:uracil-DNA glycosylase